MSTGARRREGVRRPTQDEFARSARQRCLVACPPIGLRRVEGHMTDDAMLRARESASRADTAQERNRAWWEQLPMTYERWEDEERSTSRQRAIDKFLNSNPRLSRGYFAQFAGKD